HVATLGHILHSEGEKRSRELLRKVFAALAPGGTVVIAEMVPNDERTGPPFALFFALNMLVHTDTGDTFTFAEMKSWLEQTGFTKRDGRLVPFEPDRISQALFAASEALGRPDAFLARELADGVLHFVGREFAAGDTPTTGQIADLVAKVTRELGQPALAQAFA